MNWEMIGAAGVIATLTYLARQVRTSNRATRRAGVRELLDQSLRRTPDALSTLLVRRTRRAVCRPSHPSSDANGARALYHPDGVVNLSPEGLDERR